MIQIHRVRIFSLFLTFLLAISASGCVNQTDHTETSVSDPINGEVYHTIGVAVFSPDDPEMSMFFNYYRNYIAESFPVQFLMSETLNSADDEIAFIETMKAQGAGGIISFYGLDLERTVAACAENEIYYVLGSSSISDEVYDAVKDNPWFLGVIGPDSNEEFRAGQEMAEAFAADGARTFLIASGGAGNAANYMHYTRVEGMLTALQAALDLTYSGTIEQLAQTAELTELETDREDVRIVISPGYVQNGAGVGNLRNALETDDFDALLSAVGITDVIDLLTEEIQTSEKELLVGVVDCFSQENLEAVETRDADGNSLLNYVKGKYASMVAPAFAAMFNALEGDVDVVKPEGIAFRLYQSYWTAAGEAEYVELYGYTQSIYENAYSSVDLMNVIRIYNEAATFEEFKTLTEHSDIESVRARLAE